MHSWDIMVVLCTIPGYHGGAVHNPGISWWCCAKSHTYHGGAVHNPGISWWYCAKIDA